MFHLLGQAGHLLRMLLLTLVLPSHTLTHHFSGNVSCVITRRDRRILNQPKRLPINGDPMNKTLVTLFAALSLFVMACGGSHKYSVVGTPKASGADGTVEVEKLEGDNLMVTINLEHLPPPERIAEGKKNFVAWFQPNNGIPVRAGALAYDEDTRVGNLMATTTEKRFRLLVTAEEASNPTSPSDIIVTEQLVDFD